MAMVIVTMLGPSLINVIIAIAIPRLPDTNRVIRSAVLAICGEPSDVQTRSILQRPSYTLNGRKIYFGDGYVEIPVEIWTYNFGPYKLQRRVRFVDGLVDDIETLGYGYR